MGIRDTQDAGHPDEEPESPASIRTLRSTSTGDASPISPAIPACRQPRTSKVRFVDGTNKTAHLSKKFKAQYRDEYTNDTLPQDHLEATTQDELDYFNDHVWKALSLKDALSEPKAKVVGTRRAICNKNDASEPDIRARLVAQEVNQYAEDSVCAATPPLEALRLLMTQRATQQWHNNNRLKIPFIYVRKAYFHCLPTRKIIVCLPPELGPWEGSCRSIGPMYVRHAGRWSDMGRLLLRRSCQEGFPPGSSHALCFRPSRMERAGGCAWGRFYCAG